LLLLLFAFPVRSEGVQGYYRYPALHGDTLVFAAEGDLWKVGIGGGAATRLTSHPREEGYPAISPDGRTLAFSASYEGPAEVYEMPLTGGAPKRLTWQGTECRVVGWTPDGKILYATDHHSTLPETQIVRLDPKLGILSVLPLAQASDGEFTADGKTLFFTRQDFQGSHTKRYKGGTARNLWRYADGDQEAVPLTADYPGESLNPMLWNGRVYFLTDRDGTMNLWSMNEKGGGLKQLTRHAGWDIASASLSDGKIAYQLGADLWLYDIESGTDRKLDVTLTSDFDQMREYWIKNPMSYLTDASLSPTGDKVVLTARGQVFVAPVKKERLIEVTRNPGVRYRNARFMPDGKTILALSDESGEVEIWTLPWKGDGKPQQLTHDAKVLRWEAVPSPDGKWIANHDKDQNLWLYNTETKVQKKVATSSGVSGFSNLRWSPDSRWLAYVLVDPNLNARIYLLDARTSKIAPLTSDRYDSYSPAWTPDGNWIYFLSNRNFRTWVGSPWGSRQPDPFLANQTLLYAVSLKKEYRSPFQPPDELSDEAKEEKKEEPAKPDEKKADETKDAKDGDPDQTDDKPGDAAKKDATKKDDAAEKKPDAEKKDRVPPVEIDLDGLESRLVQIPVPPGNYDNLTTDGSRLYWTASGAEPGSRTDLKVLAVNPVKPEVKTVLGGVNGYELSADHKKLMVAQGDGLFVFDAGESAPGNLGDSRVDLSGWMFSVDPKIQWRQMFDEAWRLHRDYFYDPGLHQVDWKAMREKYRPLVDRVTTRSELSDLIAQMVAELSALHTFVVGGDYRDAPDHIGIASLGADLVRDDLAGGYRIQRLYRADPDSPDDSGPLSKPGIDAAEGDVIESVNGVDTLSVDDIGRLLRNQAGKQTLLQIKSRDTKKSRKVIAVPINQGQERNLRYADWEYSRRKIVEDKGAGRIGYVHLRALGGDTYDEWVRDFYPVFNRQGLILDLRNNRGGNTDSWILSKLLRKAWFYWQQRVGEAYWNMPYAFQGHLVVLCNEDTASDGEALTEGVKRLGLGKVIGTRTWGGEVWLGFENTLVDQGIASAAEIGVYGPDGQWLIEGHGVDPDIVADNPPHQTFLGQDAQLDAAIRYLQEEIKKNPVVIPKPPKYPNKAFAYPQEKPIPNG
jgi:tricorn protease